MVSPDQYNIACSGVELIKVECFFQVYHCPGTGFDWIAGSSKVITLGEKEGVGIQRRNFGTNNPWHIVDLSSRYSLHNLLLVHVSP